MKKSVQSNSPSCNAETRSICKFRVGGTLLNPHLAHVRDVSVPTTRVCKSGTLVHWANIIATFSTFLVTAKGHVLNLRAMTTAVPSSSLASSREAGQATGQSQPQEKICGFQGCVFVRKSVVTRSLVRVSQESSISRQIGDLCAVGCTLVQA